MSKLVLKVSISVDGFLATPSGGLEWMFPSLSDDAAAWIVDTLWQARTHLMGRTTYHEMAGHWPSSTEVFAAAMNDIPKTVISSTLEDAGWGPTEIIRGDLAEVVAQLKAQPGKDILAHGGARLAQSLARLALVDEYRLVTHPVALGSGQRLFTNSTDLKLVSATRFSGGTVAHVYQPA